MLYFLVSCCHSGEIKFIYKHAKSNSTRTSILFTGSIVNCSFRGGSTCGFVQLSTSLSVSAHLTFKVGKSFHVFVFVLLCILLPA